jgi:hypothetical protein
MFIAIPSKNQRCNKVRWNKVDFSLDLIFTEPGRFIPLLLFLCTVRHTPHVSVGVPNVDVWKFVLGATEFTHVEICVRRSVL